MKILNLTLALILLFSCATNDKNKSNKERKPQKYEGLQNSDFIAPEARIFSEGNDYYKKSLDKKKALASESLDVVSKKSTRSYEGDSTLDQALFYCYQRKFKEAEAIFKKIYRAHRKHPVYWNQSGTCELLKGNSKKALLFYNKAKDLAPDYAPPYNNLGVLYQLDGKDQKALSAYEKAGNLASFSLTPLFNLGQLYARYGLIEKAKRIFRILHKRNPEDQEVLASLCYVHLLNGDYKVAVDLYSKMDKALYREPRIGLNLALALALDGRKKDASGVLEDIREIKNSEKLSYQAKIKNLIGESK